RPGGRGQRQGGGQEKLDTSHRDPPCGDHAARGTRLSRKERIYHLRTCPGRGGRVPIPTMKFTGCPAGSPPADEVTLPQSALVLDSINTGAGPGARPSGVSPWERWLP